MAVAFTNVAGGLGVLKMISYSSVVPGLGTWWVMASPTMVANIEETDNSMSGT